MKFQTLWWLGHAINYYWHMMIYPATSCGQCYSGHSGHLSGGGDQAQDPAVTHYQTLTHNYMIIIVLLLHCYHHYSCAHTSH